MTMDDVDARIAQNLEIFKTVLTQKDKGFRSIENDNKISNKSFL